MFSTNNTTRSKSARAVRWLVYVCLALSLAYLAYASIQPVYRPTSFEDVSEDEPTAEEITGHKVAANKPRYLTIGEARSRIFEVGISYGGDIDVPKNIFDIGWYKHSPLPGVPGGSILVGHSTGFSKPGVFNVLRSLTKNDTLQVEMGDGKILNYRVTRTETKKVEDFSVVEALTPSEVGKSGLTLITCSGKFKKEINTYENRLIVYATAD